MPVAPVAVVVAGMFLVMVVFMILFLKNFIRVSPNEALIVSGRPHNLGGRTVGFRVVRGGGTFVWPLLERTDRISLEVRSAKTRIQATLTADGMPIDLEASVQYRVAGDTDSVVAAAERFLSQPASALESVVVQTIEGALRGRIGALKADEARKPSSNLAEKALDAAAADLRKLGLEVVAFNVDSLRHRDGLMKPTCPDPFCGAENLPGSKFCRMCARPFPPASK